MELSTYLNFNGHCAEAFRFYERVLGGKIVMMQTHGETPMKEHVPPDWQDKVMHVRLEVGSHAIMGSDAPKGHYAAPQGLHVSISLPSRADGERIFKELAAGGQVTMPFEKTFWAAGFGMVTDRFGIPWMVNCEG
ncbi:MAG TPA: VOC family protein [Vicinamibacterales bacterium]|jgi:PhnB protein|nr:VOC family protein [Vicinamibacterales bacterium]